MKTLDEFFKKKTDNLTFIELKEDSLVKLKGYTIKANLPLPLLSDVLIEGIKEGDFEEGINLMDILQGMIYTLGSDRDFPYNHQYIKILQASDKKALEYIFYKALKDLEAGSLEDACIIFRGLLEVEPENLGILFNYGLALESIAKKFMEDGKEEADSFLEYSTRVFESILEKEKNYALSHYKLGYHYMYYGHFLKASLSWKKFLTLSNDEVLVQEVRNEIEKIEDDAIYETGITYLIYKDYDKALDSFLKLIPKHEESWNINFSIGQAYMGLEEYDKAIGYINKAIELNDDNPDLYNELGIIYINLDMIAEAIEVFTNGIEACEDDYKLYFNRGIAYTLLNDYSSALSDVNKAYELNPTEEIKNHKEELEKSVDNLYNI